MAFDLVRIHKHTGERARASVSCYSPFKEQWEPLAAMLGLQLVPLLGDAGWLDEAERQGLIQELEQMRACIRAQPDDPAEWIADQIHGILEMLMSGTCEEYEFVTG
jgi:hypothetical protein